MEPDAPPFAVTDLHSHLVPGVDDGTRSVLESLDSLRSLHAEGVRALITTPHLLVPQLDTDAALERELARHRRAFDGLLAACEGEAGLPAIALGQEIWAADAVSARRVARAPGLGLGGTPYLLVEFGFDLTGGHEDVIEAIREGGRRVLVAHAERYRYLPDTDPIEQMRVWRDMGALLQVNAGSFTGHYRVSNPGSERLAWRMVENDLVDVIATDHHGPRRTGVSPGEAYRALAAGGYQDLAQRAMGTVPATIARGEVVETERGRATARPPDSAALPPG